MGIKTYAAIWILGFGSPERLGPALDQSHLKTTWSWRAVQADRDTQKDKAWRAYFLKKEKKSNWCIFTGRE